MLIDLSLKNEKLYRGCAIGEVGGRLTLTTPPSEAANIVGHNAQAIVDATSPDERAAEVTLTGPMAVWAYLVVFHIVVHRFGRVFYDDGRGNKVLIAQH